MPYTGRKGQIAKKKNNFVVVGGVVREARGEVAREMGTKNPSMSRRSITPVV